MAGEVERAVELLDGACRIVVLTGAGMSRESGVPTFRDAHTGLWARYDPQDLATPEAFGRHPARVFGWYLYRWRQARAANPHSGHSALVSLEAMFDVMTVVTQNVDALHQRAGSSDVVELHGSLEAFRCVREGHLFDTGPLESLETVEGEEVTPPDCPVCDSPIRPGVVWFGEMLPRAALSRAWQAAGTCGALLAVGTSALVYPAAALPGIALAAGAKVIEINPQRTSLSAAAHVWWPATAGASLPALAEALGSRVVPP